MYRTAPLHSLITSHQPAIVITHVNSPSHPSHYSNYSSRLRSSCSDSYRTSHVSCYSIRLLHIWLYAQLIIINGTVFKKSSQKWPPEALSESCRRPLLRPLLESWVSLSSFTWLYSNDITTIGTMSARISHDSRGVNMCSEGQALVCVCSFGRMCMILF